MARTPSDSANRSEEEHLKRELRNLARSIAENNDFSVETLEMASTALERMRRIEARRGRRSSSGSPLSPATRKKKNNGDVDLDVPEGFVCPISSELMRDPVVVATGETYDRPFIQAWLNAGNRTCPATQQVLSHSILTPNHLVRRMISQWCESHNIQLPPHDSLEGVTVTQGERIQLDSLLKKISFASISEQKQAAKELRHLTKRVPSFRALLGEKPDSISQLLSLLSSPDLDKHPELQEDVVTTILNLSIHDNNKKIVGDDPQAIPLLIAAMKTGTMVTRSNAAAALFTLSALDNNKLKIGELGALKPLIELLETGSPVAKKDAASAIFSLCVAHENKQRAIGDGVVRVLLLCITEVTLVDESLAILAMLASNQHAVEEIGGNSGVPQMLSIIRDSECKRNQENAIVILYSVCMYDRMQLKNIREEETCSACISWLAQNGTSRARRKATGILDRLNRGRDMFSPCGTP